MNILLTPVGSHGDVHPFVGLGIALKQRGHSISLIAAEPYQPLAERHGFDFAQVGTSEEFQRMAHDPMLWHPSKSMRAVFNRELLEKYLPLAYGAIESRYVRGQTLLVGGSLAFAARIANEKLGIPLASVHLQPITILSVTDPPKFPGAPHTKYFPRWVRPLIYWYGERLVLDGFLAAPVNGFRATLGLPPVKRVWGKWRHSPQLILGLFPKWFATARDWPAHFHQTGFIRYDQGEAKALPPEVEEFLNAGEPPVVVSFGSAMRQGRPYFTAAAEACRRLGKRCMILAKNGDQIPPDLPAGCRQFDYAPFSLVFPRAAAVVHHGGIGTTAQCLAAGVPQFVMPLAFDQPDNADRLERLGVATSLLAAKFTADRATKKLDELLRNGRIKAVCESVRSKMEDDPLPRTCELIEGIV
ncbi:glycosyltransferase [Limnoglobus roseus]|uniref:GT1 family glycosyltransferase n=1 Tax=Limnoglobus roseus TaxID=2598579 RepID=A0A5C1A7W8_9BACT|nr:nucleotide disphospho-sugar-binding domain-containing protein [Limnoglobus roseus]QEL14585.1 GT1 family glycosyltransferase [Limnoglobus roseus]